MEQKQLLINANLLKGMIDYLGTRPYQEVAQLLDAVRQGGVADIPADKEEEAPTEE